MGERSCDSCAFSFVARADRGKCDIDRCEGLCLDEDLLWWTPIGCLRVWKEIRLR